MVLGVGNLLAERGIVFPITTVAGIASRIDPCHSPDASNGNPVAARADAAMDGERARMLAIGGRAAALLARLDKVIEQLSVL